MHVQSVFILLRHAHFTPSNQALSLNILFLLEIHITGNSHYRSEYKMSFYFCKSIVFFRDSVGLFIMSHD